MGPTAEPNFSNCNACGVTVIVDGAQRNFYYLDFGGTQTKTPPALSFDGGYGTGGFHVGIVPDTSCGKVTVRYTITGDPAVCQRGPGQQEFALDLGPCS